MTTLDENLLAKVLKSVIKNGKYVLGLKEGTKSLKNIKLLVYSNSLDKENIHNIEETCKASSIPVIAYPRSSVALGTLCGKPFRVTVISVRSAGDVDITPLIKK